MGDPPKLTIQAFDDGDSEREKRMRAFFEYEQAGENSRRLLEILGYLRESSWQAAINRLEADLDASVVALDKGLQLMPPRVREALERGKLKKILLYRLAHPRVMTGNWETREQAQRILDDFEKK